MVLRESYALTTNQHNHDVLARRLKSARKAAGLSQRLLGMAAGIDEGSAAIRINRYEQAVHMPDFITAVNLATVLSVPTAYLFCETEELAELLLALHKADNATMRAVKMLLNKN